MGKSELKVMANRAKAKGLQKLRWYCQMCEKQCRDENGFKCHCSSESHRRQMAVFGQAPDRAVERFSGEFLDAFLALLRHGHRGSRVAATVVYNELVADRCHVHMNSTRWATLSEFVEFLGRQGLARVEHTPKGWFVAYIDRDPEQTVKAAGNKRKRVESDELTIARQIERAQKKSMADANGDHDGDDLGRSDEYSGPSDADQEAPQEDAEEINKVTGKIAIALRRAAPATPEVKPEMKFGLDEEEKRATNNKGKDAGKVTETRRSAIDDLMEEEEKANERSNRKDHWLCPGIVVKVMSRSLAEKGHHYYNRKGLVKRVIDRYVGEIEMLESKHVVRVDQDELETVIPQIGELVRVVNGAYRGSNARLLSVDTDRFSARLRVEKGLYDGRVLEAVEYEDFCKVA